MEFGRSIHRKTSDVHPLFFNVVSTFEHLRIAGASRWRQMQQSTGGRSPVLCTLNGVLMCYNEARAFCARDPIVFNLRNLRDDTLMDHMHTDT